MRAPLAVGLGLAALAALLLYLLLRDGAPPSVPAAAPKADAPAIEFERTPVVESPHDAAPVEPEVVEPASPPAKQPAPPRPAPAALAQQSDVALERLPERWTPPRDEFGRVTVIVTSRPDRKPLEGVLVWLESDLEHGLYEMPEPLYTDVEGRATFERVPAGEMRVSSRPVGGNPRLAEIDGETSTVALSVGIWLRAVEGVVLTSNGQPASSAEIWPPVLDAAHDLPRPLARTDESGKFRLWLTNFGDSYLCARRGDALPSNIASIPPHADGTTERVELFLGPIGQTLEVRVVGPQGEIIANARVWACLTGERSLDLPQWSTIPMQPNNKLWRSRTDSQGQATLEGLPRGLLYVGAAADGHVSEEFAIRLPHPELPVEPSFHTITVADGRCTLTLLPGAMLEGRVRMPDGSPAARAAVRAGNENQIDSVTTRTDENGYFRLHNVSTRSRRVYARLGDLGASEDLPRAAADGTRWWSPVLRYDGRR